MASLRKRQHRERTARLLDAAADLFGRNGYHETHVTDIAKAADLSPTTVYNYFSNKRNIIMALAVRHARMALPERRALLRNPPDDPLDAVIAYEDLLASQSVRVMPRECWRVIFGTLYEEPGGEAHRTVLRLNKLVYRHYVRILSNFQSAGKIRADIPIEDLASMIVGIGTFHWMQFLADEEIPLVELQRRVNSQLQIAFRGLYLDKTEEGS
ncbi:TetR/AcrR family transcriptional regulator [Rhodobacteraceae bacterium NNCM2]|nr:TetR/AcrR family transcriptional regulator [Coraliihabitans acroporae]